jgi:hypothetical protein
VHRRAPYCREAAEFLVAGRATCNRLFAAASSEDHPHQREDILRSALVFGCAALDRVAKSVVERGLGALLTADSAVEQSLVKFATQYLAPGGVLDPKKVATLLVGPYMSRDEIRWALVRDLTGGSLQSFEELMKVANYLRVNTGFLLGRQDDVRATFQARNQIVHEMDLAHDGRQLLRAERSAERYFELTSTAVALGDELVIATGVAIETAFSANPYYELALRQYKETGDASILPNP